MFKKSQGVLCPQVTKQDSGVQPRLAGLQGEDGACTGSSSGKMCS